MEPARSDMDPFWNQFCDRFSAETLHNPNIFLWAGLPPPSAGFTCQTHAISLALYSLLTLCTMSHMLTLRRPPRPVLQGGREGQQGEPGEPSKETEELPRRLVVKTRFWVILVLAAALGILWGGFALWMAASSLAWSSAEFRDPAHLDQVVFATGQAVGWFVIGASFWACQSRGIVRLFSTARVFMLFSTILACIMAPFSVWRLIHRDSFPSSFAFQEDVLVLLSLPATLFFGAMAYSGDTGLAHEVVLEDPLREHLLGTDREEPLEPKLCETVTGFDNAGLVSTALFSFAVPLLELGADTTLTQDDVPQLRPVDRSLPIFDRFDASLRKLQGKEPERPPRLALAIFTTFYPIFIVTALLNLLQTCFMFAGPLLIPTFVEHLGGAESADGQGVLLVVVLLLASVLASVFGTQQDFRGEVLGMNLQSALVGSLFQKGLRLSAKAKQQSSVGEIVNYMSTDSQRLKDMCYELNNIWVLPLQIVVALAILYHLVGLAMLAGLGVMLGIMLMNLVVAMELRNSMAKTMDCKDARLKATTEALKSMKVIKLYAWQDHFEDHIFERRKEEVHWLTRYMYSSAVNIFLLWLSPLAVAVATFATMIFLGQPLDAGAVFAAIATFRILQEPLRSFPGVISAVTQALVSLQRLKEFLASSELQPDAVTRLPATVLGARSSSSGAGTWSGGELTDSASCSSAGPSMPQELAVEIVDGAFSWENDSGNMTLSGIDLRVRRGARVAVCGAVGAGKSSLLSCILGELPRLQGKVTVWGTTAYVAQSAWIQNCTVRENILFGQPLDEARYKETLRCCCLEKDISLFSHRDETQIGERGVNLSGGQKQRIQLARALYHGADTFLLDDPFSAVDAHTGSELYMEYILGALQGKTVILVTHQIEFLPAVDNILVMRGGKIVQEGSFDELRESGTDLAALVEAHEEALKAVDSATQLSSMGDAPEDGEDAPADDAAPREGRSGTGKQSLGADKGGQKGRAGKEEEEEEGEGEGCDGAGDGQLISDEEKESGQVSSAVYWAYTTKVLGGALIPVLLIIQLAWQALDLGSNFWLASYTSGKAHLSQRGFLDLYALLALGSGAFVLMRTVIISWAGLAITQSFYRDMLHSVFRAPMAFFDSTPIGRILSRSSTDQGTMDLDIPFSFGSLLAVSFALLGTLFVCSFVTWPVLFAIIPLTYLYLSFKDYYLCSSRELTRLDGITRAPIIEHFSESLAGAAVIRAFGHSDRFAAQSRDKVDTNNRMYFHYGATTLWTAVHLQLVGSTLLGFTALMLVSLPTSVVTPGLAGMSLSYGLALSDGLFFLVWVWCALENEMISVERVKQFSKLQSEKALILEDRPLPNRWPSAGHIVFDHVQVRYREDMPLVLKGISLDIAAGSKLGVVGRTGSGKSTLVAALFRLVEPCQGDISIDGLNILTEVGLADLRSRLSIIPQDPTLFDGSVRYNLDPLEQYSEADIWEALEKCQLAEVVRLDDKKLDADVAEGGENWSVGQRQLFCLGRALLKKSRVIVLDEATASVDSATDGIIQRTIRDNFGDSTVISIAHRIPTVMDSDTVLVMEQGEAAEYDAPAKLLESQTSMFSKLVAEYSARSSEIAEVARSSSVENFSSS